MHDAADRHPSRRLSQATREQHFGDNESGPSSPTLIDSEPPDTEKKNNYSSV